MNDYTTTEHESDGRSTDLQTTLCDDGRHINVRNTQSGSGNVHTVSIAIDGDVSGCTCDGWTYNQHCYHVDSVRSSPLLLASARSLSQQVATDGGTQIPEITHHTEPDAVGGQRYARYEGCDSESVEDSYGDTDILHEDNCPL